MWHYNMLKKEVHSSKVKPGDRQKAALEGPINLSQHTNVLVFLWRNWVWRWHQPSVSALKCHKNHCCHYPSTKPSLSSLFSTIPSGLHAIVSLELARGIVLSILSTAPPSSPHLFFSKRQQNSKGTKWIEDIKDVSGEKPPLVYTLQGL